MLNLWRFETLDSYYRRLGSRGRVVLCQLPLSVSILLVVAVSAVVNPGTLQDPRFQWTLLPHLLLLALCAVVPWGKLPSGSFAVIPILDCLAISLSREAGGQILSALGLLTVFPVIWLAAIGPRGRVLMAILATVLSALLAPIILGVDFGKESVVRLILPPMVFTVIAVTVHVVASVLAGQRSSLEAKDRELQHALSDSQRRQRLMDTVVETVGVGVWVVNAEGATIFTNSRFQSDLARAEAAAASHGETATSRSEPAAGPSTDAPNIPVFESDRVTPMPPDKNPVARALAGQNITEELLWVGTGDTQRAYSTTARTIRDSDGAFTGSVIAFTDVTALVGALAAKDNFVSTVSHELRTPLTSILGYLELIIDEPDSTLGREQLLVIERNAQRLLHLVNDLLAVASDSVDLAMEETDLAGIVEEALESARPRAAASAVKLVADMDRPLPARVDPERVGQVVDNLLSNAIKYSPNGGLVTVRTHRDGSRLVCSVTDSGIGMNPEEQENAFAKFFRAARARDTAIPGAGLGLPISKTIVESHGGSISLTSRPGAGTTVTFTLPAAN
ncbi:cell wall metabolism sensor histidine kinase WalK [Arthrobacter sp. ISL-30]|uniref:sensor histidine kinase n=1 Tax=Arthrobacter sp. ISL-30 TaxID=2819109 RepID=UPI0020360B15|nr:HAMP domain-containing sensor histidine kinase [Arthrobacter sp. ISL-30]